MLQGKSEPQKAGGTTTGGSTSKPRVKEIPWFREAKPRLAEELESARRERERKRKKQIEEQEEEQKAQLFWTRIEQNLQYHAQKNMEWIESARLPATPQLPEPETMEEELDEGMEPDMSM